MAKRKSLEALEEVEKLGFRGYELTALVQFKMFTALILALNEIADSIKEARNG